MAGPFSWQSVRPRSRGEMLGFGAAAFGGAVWLRQRLLGYPPGYFLPDDSAWPVTTATFLALVSGGLLVAAALAAPVLALRHPDVGTPPACTCALGPGLVILLVSAALRFAFSRELPGAPWTDGVYALHQAAAAGRFLWPWESMPLVPAELGPSKILLFDVTLDFARALLSLAPDRHAAYALLSSLPGSLIPLAVFFLTRRLASTRAAWIGGLLAATGFPFLVQARWGWDQQMMVLFLLLALERVAAGLHPEKPGRLLAGGLLAGIALHTYLGSLPAVAALALYLLGSGIRRRRARPFFAFTAGLALPALMLALVYARRPEAFGGRAGSLLLAGPPAKLARSLALNLVDYAGLFSFSRDLNVRHGDPSAPPFNVLVAVLLPAGLLIACGPRWGALLAVLSGSLAGGFLSSPLEAPNGYRVGLALALAMPLAAAGLDALAHRTPPRLSRGALALVVVLAAGLLDTGRFLRWGLLNPTPWGFGPRAAAAGAFASSVGRQSVAVDPTLLLRDDSIFLVSFWVDADRPLEPLRPLPMRTSSPLGGACAGVDWFVSTHPPPGRHTIQLGFPGTPEGSVSAARCRP